MACTLGSEIIPGKPTHYEVNWADMVRWFGSDVWKYPEGVLGMLLYLPYDLTTFCVSNPPSVPAWDFAMLGASGFGGNLFDNAYAYVKARLGNYVWNDNCRCVSASVAALCHLTATATAANNTASAATAQCGPVSSFDHVTYTASQSGMTVGTWNHGILFYNASNVFISESSVNSVARTTTTVTRTVSSIPAGAVYALARCWAGSDATTGGTFNQDATFYGTALRDTIPLPTPPSLTSVVGYTPSSSGTTDQVIDRIATLQATVNSLVAAQERASGTNTATLNEAVAALAAATAAATNALNAENAASDAVSAIADANAKLDAAAKMTDVTGTSLATGAEGSNDVALPSGTVAVSVVVTSYPGWKGHEWSSPLFIQDLGLVSLIGTDGIIETRKLATEETFWVDVPPSATSAAVQLAPGVVASIATYEKS